MKNYIEEILKKQKEAKNLILKAKKNRKFNKFDLAKQYLNKAIKNLNDAVALYEQMTKDETSYIDYGEDLYKMLSDTYGMQGGIFRRMDEFEESLNMYTQGAIIEDEYNIDETYNRLNYIVLSIIHTKQICVDLKNKINKVLTISTGLTQGTNNNKWWAWSDKGLLLLLNSYENKSLNKETYFEDVIYAYRQFRNKGADKASFLTTIEVLEELSQSIAVQDPFTSLLFKDIISFLQEEIPKNIYH